MKRLVIALCLLGLLPSCSLVLTGDGYQRNRGRDVGAPDAGPAADAPGLDAPGLDAPGLDAPGLDAPGTDAPGLDAPGTDAPGLDAPGTDAPGTDAPGTDAPGTDAPGTDAPPVPGCTVPDDHATVADALAALPLCSVITVRAGTYPAFAVNRAATIVGEGAMTVFEGDATAPVIRVNADDVVLRNFTVTGGRSDTGGGIQASGRLTLEGLTVRNNTATNAGGGVYAEDDLTATDCSFVNNSVIGTGTVGGGGVFFTRPSGVTSATARFERCSFDRNSVRADSPRGGGGLWAEPRVPGESFTVELIDTSLSTNSLTATSAGSFPRGGGVLLRFGTLTIEGEVTIDGNTVQGQDPCGGGVAVEDASLTITGSASLPVVLRNNTATGSATAMGGGLFAQEARVVLGFVTLEANRAAAPTQVQGAGAFFASTVARLSSGASPALDVTDSSFLANVMDVSSGVGSRTASGGGLFAFVGSGTQSDVRRSTFARNLLMGSSPTSSGYGLGANVVGASATMPRPAALFENCSFGENSGEGFGLQGGGLYASAAELGALTVDVRACTFVNNTARGSGLALNGGTLTVSGSAFVAPGIGSLVEVSGPSNLVSGGYNFLDPMRVMGTMGGDLSTHVTMGLPGVGALGNWGGPTQTWELTTPSALIDRMPCMLGGVVLTQDQRGQPRPGRPSTMCDIGAIEFSP